MELRREEELALQEEKEAREKAEVFVQSEEDREEFAKQQAEAEEAAARAREDAKLMAEAAHKARVEAEAFEDVAYARHLIGVGLGELALVEPQIVFEPDADVAAGDVGILPIHGVADGGDGNLVGGESIRIDPDVDGALEAAEHLGGVAVDRAPALGGQLLERGFSALRGGHLRAALDAMLDPYLLAFDISDRSAAAVQAASFAPSELPVQANGNGHEVNDPLPSRTDH